MAVELVAGVAGAGVFGGHHAQKYAAIDGVRLGAIYDIDDERARSLARRHGADAYTDFAAFLRAVDLLTIAAPASDHFDLARTALEAGRHILVEKPLATRLDHAKSLIALAGRKRLVLQVGHQERFVAEAFGVLERPSPPRSVWCRRHNPKSGRGEDVSVVLDLMVHDLDLVRSLGLGAVKSVSATGDADDLEAEFVFDGGATATFCASRNSPRVDRRMTLVYDDGVIELDFVNRLVGNTTPTPLRTSFEDAVSPPMKDPLGWGVSLFVEAIRGRCSVAIPGERGRDALEWALIVERVIPSRDESVPELIGAGR